MRGALGTPAGITATLSCSPFVVLPPEVLDALQIGIHALGERWGVKIGISQSESIQEAQVRFHMAQRTIAAALETMAKADTEPVEK